jgi:hypothetical protein
MGGGSREVGLGKDKVEGGREGNAVGEALK